ncbi:MAG: BamA/TamA family outer membrane protein [Vicingaceae bacterium]|nr:BamA/TamA family outer membrane protein [Vicingaceae bacterium]
MYPFSYRIFLLSFFLSSAFFVFAQEQKTASFDLVVQEIKIIGNKTTKEKIITRELTFELGDSISSDKISIILEKSKNNLLNTLLFNFVTVDLVYFDSTNISIYIMLEERWYWWPTPIFEIQETNFNTWWQTKDMERINYGFYVVKENFRGRKERLSIKLQAGYTEQARIKYKIPYINKKQTHGLNFTLNYNRNHEITYATTNNVRDFYRDEEDYVRNQTSLSIGYNIRPKIYNQHIIQGGFTNVAVADTIAYLNSDYLPGAKNNLKYLSFGYGFYRDKRNFKSYPTKGVYYDFAVVKNGFGILSDELNLITFSTQYKKYWQLYSRVFFAATTKVKYTAKEGPYYLYGGLGYVNNLVRGYELYVINGEHTGLTKLQLRYALVDNKIFKLRPVPWDKFNKIPLSIYLGSFFDSGYVSSRVNQQNNFLTNTALYGGGLSLDFVSYYDVVFRMEYSINHLSEHGLYLHFIAPL